MTQKERIVIIGGGFAGLNLVKKLDRQKFSITIVDKNNYHSFPPLFYQIASSGLDPASICFPFRRELRKQRARGARYNMGTVTDIDFDNKCVTTDYETLYYDKLIIAAGTTNNFFNMPQLQKSVYTIKSTSEAIRCRNEILDRLERASLTTDAEKRKQLLSFVVIGGGPTGVEIAGAIGEMKRYILQREYPAINIDDLTITIIEGSDRLLRTMSPEASASALKSLKELMVTVRLGVNMSSYENNIITLADGSEIYTEAVIWTAGVTGVPFNIKSSHAPEYGRGKRFPVNEFCEIAWAKDAFALGDIAIMQTDPAYPEGHPQLAQVAIQQSATLAKNLNEGQFTHPFHYNDKGSMATIGRNRAVADLGKMHISGYPAWVIWMFIHLISILGMRNKVTVLINWLWAYFTYGTSLRLLIHPDKYPLRSRWGEK